ncbi:hypothetical protein C8Q77DRAFT_1155823 [Trametes polyzona]|nr:hypothetical protein C8Q77DRAFT_1155823 [Trametes polyzona]
MSSGLLQELSAEFGPELEKTYGAYLIGTCISLALYGISLHQFYRYIRLHPTDTAFIRALVFIVMLLETAQVPMLMHTCYWALVTHFFDPLVLSNDIWSVQISPTISGLITLTAQAFFARRVSILGARYKVIAALAGVCLVTFLGMTIAVTVLSGKLHSLGNFGPSTEWLFSAGLWFATVADLLLSGSIIVALRRSRSTYVTRSQERKLDLFMIYVVNTGFLTGVFNAIPSILATTNPKTFTWAAASYVATRLYANTLFAVLNSRKLMVSRGIEIFGPAVFERNIIARANHLAAVEQWGAPQLPDNGPAVINIKVTAEREADAVGTISGNDFRVDKLDYQESV